MKISFLIVTRSRPVDLALTLNKLKAMIDLSIHEVLVFIDGCSKTESIKSDFDWVNWTSSIQSISASPARNTLYKKASGSILIGLDDDAHPLSNDFINSIEATFNSDKNIGIIAFQEVRGLFDSDEEGLKHSKKIEAYFTNDFIGCGFAIKKEAYNATRGFPVWMDIYGEESALAIEVLDLDYTILYQPNIMVNHRVDVAKRKLLGRNYFRFEHQLQNTLRYYLVYYSNPIKKIIKTLWHNFKKYALKDRRYCIAFIKVSLLFVFKLPVLFKFRKPVSQKAIKTRISAKALKY